MGELDLGLTGSLEIIQKMHNEACSKFGKNFVAVVGITLGRTGWVFFFKTKTTNIISNKKTKIRRHSPGNSKVASRSS